MILLSPDAVEDVERLRAFLDQNNPGAARRALALIWTAIDRLQEFPDMGMRTEDADIRQVVVRFGAQATSCVMPYCRKTRIYSSRGYGTAVRHGPDTALQRAGWVGPNRASR